MITKLKTLTNSRTSKVLRLYSTEASSKINKREEYYKNFGKFLDAEANVKPKGWDDALPFKMIPGPKPLPLIGNIHHFLPGGSYYAKPFHELYEMLQQEYGNIVVLKNLPGRKVLVCVFEPDDIEVMLRNEGPYPIRYGVMPYVHYRNVTRKGVCNASGVLAVQGEEWFKARAKINPILMEPRMAKLYVPGMDSVAEDMLNLMRFHASKSPVSEMPANFLQEIYKWSFESIASVAFDTRFGCLDVNLPKDSHLIKYIADVNRMFDLLFQLEIRPALYKYIPTFNWMELVKILDRLTSINMQHLNRAIAKPDDPNKAEHEKSVARRLMNIDKDVAVAMTIDMMLAGVDTTGRLLAAVLYFLARHPEIQTKLREEVVTKLPSKSSKVTPNDLYRAPYLRAVIKETLRLAPVVVGTIRTTVKDLVLGGYQIPKGVEVLGVTHSTSNSEKYFKNPKEFIPERWLKSVEDDEISSRNVNPYSYLPFGFGPRQCAGKRFASLEVEVALLRIIRNFELSWHHRDMRFESALLYGVGDPLKLRVHELGY